MTENRTPAPAVPQWTPSAAELDDLAMLLQGAYRPLEGFLGAAEVRSVTESARLADGTPWPVPVTVTVPDAVAHRAAALRSVVLLDEEGTPVATVTVDEVWSVGDGRSGIAGTVTGLGVPRPVPFRPGRGGAVLGVPVRDPVHAPDLAALHACAVELSAAIVLLPLVGCGMPRRLDGAALEHTCDAARAELVRRGCRAEVAPVRVPAHGLPEDRERGLVALVAAAYGATHVPSAWAGTDGVPRPVELPDVVQDGRTGEWAVPGRVPAAHRGALRAGDVAAVIEGRIARGEAVPAALTPAVTARALARSTRAGVTVLFTGLSGSGKSTLAHAVAAQVAARGGRRTTLLDGDVVRRMLSSELDFSRAHRELNVRRIGFVAAEVTRHGGLALCAPIAPYADVRAEVRGMVEEHGRFVLVHVSTPLEVCEARDRKGLYAKARRGEIAQFTGISDPYEVPADADLAIDTSRTPLEDAVEQVLAAIEHRPYDRRG